MKKLNDFKALVLDSLGEMIFFLDRDLKVKWCSEYAGELAGSVGKDIVGKFCFNLWGQNHRPCKNCLSLKAMASAQIQQSEVLGKDGKVWELHIYPVCDTTEKVIGLAEFRADITERKNSQKALWESEKRFKTIWENIGVYFGEKGVRGLGLGLV